MVIYLYDDLIEGSCEIRIIFKIFFLFNIICYGYGYFGLNRNVIGFVIYEYLYEYIFYYLEGNKIFWSFF